MPASKLNYIVTYKNDSQVYGSGSKEIALASPPPPGSKIEDKEVRFITMEPDTGEVVWYKLPDEEVWEAEIVSPKKKADK